MLPQNFSVFPKIHLGYYIEFNIQDKTNSLTTNTILFADAYEKSLYCSPMIIASTEDAQSLVQQV